MDKNQFVIKIQDLSWIKGEKDDPSDFCLHGEVCVRIGEEIVADKYSCTVSSTALYLLKSLENNHISEESPVQMLPCCGHSIIPDDNEDSVMITGCPTGIDWTVLHTGDKVKLITAKGNELIVDFSIYRKIVYRFADEVSDFYKQSTPKIMPEDDFYRDGYIKFWKEWNYRRNKKY